MNEIKSPFEILNLFFSKTDNYKNVSNKDKKKHFFIINRRLSIGFPLISVNLSKMGINEIFALDVWYSYIRKKLKYKPQWMYLKTSKKTSTKKVKYSKEAKEYYMKINEIGEKEFNYALKYNPKELTSFLKKIDNYLKKSKK
jgi:hypothetical protein